MNLIPFFVFLSILAVCATVGFGMLLSHQRQTKKQEAVKVHATYGMAEPKAEAKAVAPEPPPEPEPELDETRAEQVARMTKEGMSRQEIADKLGLRPHTVSGHATKAREQGLLPLHSRLKSPARARQSNGPRPLPDHEEKLALALDLRKQGLTVKEIAERVDRSEGWVFQHMEKAGLTSDKRRQDELDEKMPLVVELRKQGLTLKEIAARVGKSSSWVFNVLREAGLTDGSQFCDTLNNREEKAAEARRLYAEGVSRKEIQERVEVSHGWLNGVLKGETAQEKAERRREKKRKAQAAAKEKSERKAEKKNLKAQAVELRKQGMFQEEIAAELGVPQPTVSNWLNGMRMGPRKHSKKEEAIRLRAQGLKQKEIAEKAGVHRSTVSKWLNGVPAGRMERPEMEEAVATRPHVNGRKRVWEFKEGDRATHEYLSARLVEFAKENRHLGSGHLLRECARQLDEEGLTTARGVKITKMNLAGALKILWGVRGDEDLVNLALGGSKSDKVRIQEQEFIEAFRPFFESRDPHSPFFSQTYRAFADWLNENGWTTRQANSFDPCAVKARLHKAIGASSNEEIANYYEGD